MRITLVFCAVAMMVPISAQSQQEPRPQSDSARRADSLAREDSIAIARDLGQPATQPMTPQAGPTNPRLLPDISVVGDFVADFSPKGTTQEDGARFSVREIELAFQAAVDPYFRGDIFLGISDAEGIAIEQGYLTATALPYQLELRAGRWLMPFGKQNSVHRHDLHTVDYPYVLQRFLGEEGGRGTGLWLGRIFSPFGFYQELIVTAIDRLGEAPEDLTTEEPLNKKLGGLGYSARFRNYWDVSESANFELSFSGMTGKRERELEEPFTGSSGATVNAVGTKQTVFGTDLTFRWRPLQQGLYKSFILQAEYMRQMNNDAPGLVAPVRDYTGSYVFARYQVSRRGFLGVRYDGFQDPELGEGRYTHAGSAYLEFFPSEFSKLLAAYERYAPPGGIERTNRFLVQATFALGPHKPHPF